MVLESFRTCSAFSDNNPIIFLNLNPCDYLLEIGSLTQFGSGEDGYATFRRHTYFNQKMKLESIMW